MVQENVVEAVLLRGEEVAMLLNISRAKAFKMMNAREIPVVRLGKSIRCPREALLAMISKKTQHPSAALREKLRK